MRALTLWQPWAQLIADERKKIETRSWGTSYRGPMAIHAATDRNLDHAFAKKCGYDPDALVCGAVICIVELWDCESTNNLFAEFSKEERKYGNFAPNRFAWHMRLTEKLPLPVLARGAQSLWNWERKH